jgi:hypothetical protein
MTRSQLWLIAFGLLDISVIAWIIVSSLQTGLAPGMRGDGANLPRRDQNPFRFWSSICFYFLIGAAFLAAVIYGLFWQDRALQP